MTDREELMRRRSELIRKSSKETCWPCTDVRKQNKVMRYDDPITSGCMCEKIEGWVDELKAVEAEMGLKRR